MKKNFFQTINDSTKKIVVFIGLGATVLAATQKAEAQLAYRNVITSPNGPVTIPLATTTNLAAANIAPYSYPIGDKPGVVYRPDLTKDLLVQGTFALGTNVGAYAVGFVSSLDRTKYSSTTNWFTNSYTLSSITATNTEITHVFTVGSTNLPKAPYYRFVGIQNTCLYGSMTVSNLMFAPSPN